MYKFVGSNWLVSGVLAPVIGGVPVLNIQFLDLFRTDFHIIGRRRVASHMFRFLDSFSISLASLMFIIFL